MLKRDKEYFNQLAEGLNDIRIKIEENDKNRFDRIEEMRYKIGEMKFNQEPEHGYIEFANRYVKAGYYFGIYVGVPIGIIVGFILGVSFYYYYLV